MDSAKKTPIRFLIGWSYYRAGEVAGFDAAQCASLVASGIAVYLTPTPSAPIDDITPALEEVRPRDVPESKQVEIVITPEGNIDTMPTKRRRWNRKG